MARPKQRKPAARAASMPGGSKTTRSNWFAGIPTSVKVLATIFGAVLAYHIAARTAATAPFRGDALAAQKYLGSVSDGGRHYAASLADDRTFKENLVILFNVNNDYAGSWFIYDPWAMSLFKCPFLKQYRQFVLGESEPGKWDSDAKFLDAGAIVAATELYHTFDAADRRECLPTYADKRP